MEHMINKHLIKKLRTERAWSQEQLASVTGLSLRTIQRIETTGKASLESKRALAASFEIEVSELESKSSCQDTAIASESRLHSGAKLGMTGAVIGLILAYVGITRSLLEGLISAGEAGLYYGGVGACCGLSCALIGFFGDKWKVALQHAEKEG